jgi:hypothetical protein
VSIASAYWLAFPSVVDTAQNPGGFAPVGIVVFTAEPFGIPASRYVDPPEPASLFRSATAVWPTLPSAAAGALGNVTDP